MEQTITKHKTTLRQFITIPYDIKLKISHLSVKPCFLKISKSVQPEFAAVTHMAEGQFKYELA